MPKVVSVEQMVAIEKAADESGMIDYDTMMQNAGRATAEVVRQRLNLLTQFGRVAVLVGPGNNGGDGLVAARIIAEETEAEVGAYLLEPREDDLFNAAQDAGVFLADAESDQRWRILRTMVENADVLVDALLGTGIDLPLRDEAAKLLRQASGAAFPPAPARRLIRPASSNRVPVRRAFVVAVDCPSGLDCDTGEADPNTIPADITVTFAAAKRGHFASNLVGELIIADIGISDRLPALRDVTVEVATDVADLIPQRDPFGHKGTFGTVLVVAGSTHFTGAAALSGMAAYQSGAGLVRMAVPQPLHPILAGSLYEPVWLPLPHEAGAFAPASLGVLRDQAGGFDALLLGPGIGQSEPTAAFLRDLLAETELIEHAPLVIDADGLNLLAAQDAWWEQLPEHTVLTPHPGEMARLARLDTAVVQADRIGVAQRSAAKWGCVIVLKGAHTVVATPDGGAVIIPFASDALATAGSGDVLAGCIASLIAQGATPWDAAVAGAYVHAVAGSQVAEWIGSSRGVVAGDIPRALPRAFASVVE